jgi:hypothetical protein
MFCLIKFPFPIHAYPSRKVKLNIWICLYFCENSYGFLLGKRIFYGTGALKTSASDRTMGKFDPGKRLTVHCKLT